MACTWSLIWATRGGKELHACLLVIYNVEHALPLKSMTAVFRSFHQFKKANMYKRKKWDKGNSIHKRFDSLLQEGFVHNIVCFFDVVIIQLFQERSECIVVFRWYLYSDKDLAHIYVDQQRRQ